MTIISATRRIEAPASRVWDAVADIGGVHRWHPKVKQSPLLSETLQGPGASRRCEFYDGTSVVEEVVDWVEGESLTMELSDMSMPLNTARATLRVSGQASTSTEISMEMEYAVKYGPLGWVMDAVMMRRMMGQMFDLILSGLDHHLITGELISESFKPAA
ncbi:MAG: hypothetical protein ACI8RZ_001492 [Myxococcota bacterium]|jgi:uncharacterized protein YndB with AHSA1/START domain